MPSPQVDPRVQLWRTLEGRYRYDLDAWLGNVYFKVSRFSLPALLALQFPQFMIVITERILFSRCPRCRAGCMATRNMRCACRRRSRPPLPSPY
jgi:hypothetical protein